ncbi:MAG: ABC transporter permease [Acutalibacteraceae bacterium]|nr:ABC transporter permease [Acutalibacteraceae bacterium]
MNELFALTKRNTKLYFKDKGMFFSSLITPVILLVLYSTFLKKVYDDSFRSALLAAGADISDSVLNGCVGGQLVSSLLAVSCVTVAFCSNLLMIKDKTSGAIHDLTITPVRFGVLGFSYYLSTLFSTLIVSFCAALVSLLYLAAVGWYLTAADVALLILDVFLLTMFGTALSSCINFFLTTDGQASAVGTIVSAGYGFICGAYMPISNFGSGLKNVLSFLPGTYGTSLLRNHFLRGTFAEMKNQGFPNEVVEAIRESVDCNLEFFGTKVEIGAMYLIICASILLLIGIYITMNIIAGKKRK